MEPETETRFTLDKEPEVETRNASDTEPEVVTENRSKQPIKIDNFFKKGAVTKSPEKIVPNPFFKPKEPIVLKNDAPGPI